MSTVQTFLGRATRILFFTGKGGVGKTSLACASAVSLARSGKQVLLVSTDPASNLDEVLGTPLPGEPAPVPDAPGLFALNIDPKAAAGAYRERVVGPYRGVLPPAAIASMEEQLSGGCTIEIAAFDEFTKLLGNPAATERFHHVIFDTAPTGHTLRLLSLPAAWTGFIATNTTGTSCLGPLAGLEAQKKFYAASLKALADTSLTTLALVSRPEASALAEAERTRVELAALGMTNQVLFLNGVFTPKDCFDEAASALEARGNRAVAEMPAGLASLPRITVRLLPFAPIGIRNLETVFGESAGEQPHSTGRAMTATPPLSSLIDELEPMARGVILAMGKGGVGKTTIAAAIAVELARRGHQVWLSTSDPAAHVQNTVGAAVAGLRVSRIDPVAETRKYAAEVQQKAAPHLDAAGKALLEEDLRSPCTEEIAVFRAFADIVSAAGNRFVVLDTAPTGHTLLLLDTAEAYHREVSRNLHDTPEPVRNLLPRLRDPDFTRVIMVTVAEATPVHEAARLQEDLERAGITPFAWVINQSFAADGFRDPALVERGAREIPFIAEVRHKLARRVALVPWVPVEPVGPERLSALARASALSPRGQSQ